MAHTFLQRLQAGETLVADGATGTNLQKVGLKAGLPPEAWVMEQPEKILALEKAFVEAGSDIILTCTFGGTRLRLKDSPYAGRIAEVNRRAVEIARQATQSQPGTLVAGSMGPVGGLLKPYGPLTVDEVREAYAEQAQALTGAGVDLLVIETQFSLEEAKAALEAARQAGDLQVVVSFSYDRGTRTRMVAQSATNMVAQSATKVVAQSATKVVAQSATNMVAQSATMMGVKPSQVVQAFQPLGVAAIGANCGTTLENMEAIVKECSAMAAGLVIWAKPNAGMPALGDDGAATYNVTPEQMGEFANRYVQAGARIVGGCCGSTPAHVAAIARAVKKTK